MEKSLRKYTKFTNLYRPHVDKIILNKNIPTICIYIGFYIWIQPYTFGRESFRYLCSVWCINGGGNPSLRLRSYFYCIHYIILFYLQIVIIKNIILMPSKYFFSNFQNIQRLIERGKHYSIKQYENTYNPITWFSISAFWVIEKFFFHVKSNYNFVWICILYISKQMFLFVKDIALTE